MAGLLLKEADWDLVIADEVHKMAAYRQGVRAKKTRKTRLYRFGEELSVRTKHLLLLAARDAALVATVDDLNRRVSI